MTDTKNINVFEKKWDVPYVIVILMLLLTALTDLVNQTILSLGIVLCCAVLLLYDKLYLAFPFMLFYNSFYGLVFGVSVFRLFSVMVLANAVIRATSKSRIKVRYLAPLTVYVLYLVAVMLPVQGISSAMFLIIDVVATLLVVSDLTKKPDTAMKDMFKVYAIVCLLSFLTGVIAGNSIGDEYNYSRFMATFEDPNYMGFFFTIAVFALITLKLFDKRIRILLVIALYAMVITTLSITAIVVNVLLWTIYLVIMKKLKWWSILIVALVIIIALALYNYGLDNPSTPVLGDLAARINEKLVSLEGGDIGDVTTGRSDLAKEHFEYYLNLPVLNILFGGIPVNTRYIHPELKYAAHNEYIDMLLNVGFFGAAIMLAYFFTGLAAYVRRYKEERKDKDLFLIMGKTVWMLYALTLTMFIDYRFMVLFLI